MTDTTVVSRNSAWITAWVGEELMMMSGESGAYLSLSYTGGRIWEMLEQSGTVEQLSGQLACEFEVDSAEARAGLVSFLEQMAEEDTVSLAERPHA